MQTRHHQQRMGGDGKNNCQTRLKISKEKPPASRKRAEVGHHNEIGTQPCAPIAKGKFIMRLMYALNSQITSTSARSVGKAGCDGVEPSSRPSLVDLQ